MRIGIYGGAFDPLHSEHIRIVDGARHQLNLDKIILVPSFNPPHKSKDMTSFDDRLAMLNIWAKDKAYIVIDSIENQLKLGDSYTAVVIPKLLERYPAEQAYYIIGGDSMVNFHTWHRPDDIASQIDLAVVARQGYQGLDSAIQHANARYNAKITKLTFYCKELSSSELRARLELDFNLGNYIEPEILEYIKTNKLYSNYSHIIEKVKKSVSADLFHHMARTAIYAVKLGATMGIAYEKAFLAGFLHDIAKERKEISTHYPTSSPKVIHQFEGRTVAASEYGIQNNEILDAIEYHTTGKPDMSQLGKLIYVADKLEEERDFAGVQELRDLVDKDFEKGFSALVARSYNHLKSLASTMDNLTIACHKYYNESN